MFTITNGTSKVVCDGCKSETLTVEKAGTRPRKTRLAVREAGWTWLGTSVQLGPKCKGKAAEFKKAAKEKKPKAEKKAKATGGKKAAPKANGSVKVTLFGKKNLKKTEKPAGPMGESIGKLARSAKVAPAPAAE